MELEARCDVTNTNNWVFSCVVPGCQATVFCHPVVRIADPDLRCKRTVQAISADPSAEVFCYHEEASPGPSLPRRLLRCPQPCKCRLGCSGGRRQRRGGCPGAGLKLAPLGASGASGSRAAPSGALVQAPPCPPRAALAAPMCPARPQQPSRRLCRSRSFPLRSLPVALAGGGKCRV